MGSRWEQVESRKLWKVCVCVCREAACLVISAHDSKNHEESRNIIYQVYNHVWNICFHGTGFSAVSSAAFNCTVLAEVSSMSTKEVSKADRHAVSWNGRFWPGAVQDSKSSEDF